MTLQPSSSAATARRPAGPRSARARTRGLLVLGALLGAALWAAPSPAAEPDYSGYEALLRQYIHVLGGKGRPWDSRFDYEQLFIDEEIHRKRASERLTTIHTQLLSVSPSTMTPRERTAWALNAYNFLVIEHMTLNLLVPGRGTQRYDSPKQVRTELGTFFSMPVARVEGREHSLTGFERRYLYGDTATHPMHDGLLPRETPGDPRLQFALCKAALASGLVVPWAYRADSLDAQLDRAVRLALALPRWIRLDEKNGMFMASNRFADDWVDHGGPQIPQLMPFLERHGTPALRKLIRARKLTRPSMFFEPDWKLNQFDHPSPPIPAAKRDSTRSG